MMNALRTAANSLLLVNPPLVLSRFLQIAGSVALLALFAQVSIQTPFSPVPVTLQTFAVALIGLMVKRLWDRVGAVAVYLLLGFSGVPVFAGGAAGLQLGASLGYLLAMVLSVAVIGDIAKSRWGKGVWGRLLAVYSGSLITLSGGALWISILFPELNWLQVGQIAVLPFLLGDFLKNMTAVSLVTVLPLSRGSRSNRYQ